jgi:hypothetical protein
MSDETTTPPPADLPTDPAAYWGTVPDNLVAADVEALPEVPVLDQLGAAPFKKLEKGGFPFLGFFASVYEHVSTTANASLHPQTSPASAASQG